MTDCFDAVPHPGRRSTASSPRVPTHIGGGRIPVLNTAKGGVATAWMLHEMRSRGMAPAALLLNRANPIMVQGAAFAGLPFIDRFEVDITRTLGTGVVVTVFPEEGLVRVDSGAIDDSRESSTLAQSDG